MQFFVFFSKENDKEYLGFNMHLYLPNSFPFPIQFTKAAIMYSSLVCTVILGLKGPGFESSCFLFFFHIQKTQFRGLFQEADLVSYNNLAE